MPDASRHGGADATAHPTADPLADAARALRVRAQGYVDRRKAEVVRTVSDVAGAVRAGGDTLDDHPRIKAAFDRAALEADGLAEGIARRSLGEMMADVEAAVRRRPRIAAAAAITAGLGLLYVARRPGGSPPTHTPPEAPVDRAVQAET